MGLITFRELSVLGRELGTLRISVTIPTAPKSATALNAVYRLPVLTVTQPTKAGQTAPPKEPMALISAMPPAAALPSRYPLGIVQNRLRMLKMAIDATASSINRHSDAAGGERKQQKTS